MIADNLILFTMVQQQIIQKECSSFYMHQIGARFLFLINLHFICDNKNIVDNKALAQPRKGIHMGEKEKGKRAKKEQAGIPIKLLHNSLV